MKIIQNQDEYLFVKSTEPYQLGMLIELMRKIAATCWSESPSKMMVGLSETNDAVKRLHVKTSQ